MIFSFSSGASPAHNVGGQVLPLCIYQIFFTKELGLTTREVVFFLLFFLFQNEEKRRKLVVSYNKPLVPSKPCNQGNHHSAVKRNYSFYGDECQACSSRVLQLSNSVDIFSRVASEREEEAATENTIFHPIIVWSEMLH